MSYMKSGPVWGPIQRELDERHKGGDNNMSEALVPRLRSYVDGMLDITGAENVQVEPSVDGSVLWVNVDGKCVLRICRIAKPIKFTDGIVYERL